MARIRRKMKDPTYTPVSSENKQAKDNRTREYLASIGVLQDYSKKGTEQTKRDYEKNVMFSSDRAQSILEGLKVKGLYGEEISFKEAKDLDKTLLQEATRRGRNTPYYGKNLSEAVKLYKEDISNQAVNKFYQLLEDADRPENKTINLLTEQKSSYYNPSLSDYPQPTDKKETPPTAFGARPFRRGGKLPEYQTGGRVDLGQVVDLGLSVANTASNIAAANSIETEQTPSLIRRKRTPFKSLAPRMQEIQEGAYRSTLEANPNLNASTRSNLFAQTLKAGNELAFQDEQNKLAFEARQDALDAQANAINAQTTNQINETNLARRNMRTAARAGAASAGVQDIVNIQDKYDIQNQQAKQLALSALQSGDTGVIERMAKQYGYEDVFSFLEAISNPRQRLGRKRNNTFDTIFNKKEKVDYIQPNTNIG